MVVSLGPTPMSTALDLVPKNPRSDGTGSNPRCLRRDVNRNAAMGATADRALSLISGNQEMDGFYNQLLGMPIPKNDSFPWGVSARLDSALDLAGPGLADGAFGTDPHGRALCSGRGPWR
jgi:hypothetical protein